MPLRPLAEPDLPMILAWRNDPFVRLNMFYSHVISESEHAAWFARISQDASQYWMIHENDIGEADGVVYFTDHDTKGRLASWGFYRCSHSRGGSGSLLGLDGLDFAFSTLNLHKLNAEVLASNPRSMAYHERLGFKREGLFRDAHPTECGYVDVLRYGLLEDEWRQHRHHVVALAKAHRAESQRTE